MVRTAAVLTLLAFGCTTVRVPALPAGELQDAPGTIAQPSIELWLESSDPVPQPQSDMAADAAREAISRALSEVRISSSALGATDAVLFVRERGVALTDARRSQQTWAKVGIVVGVVVVVVGIIIGVTKATGSHGGSNHVVRAPAAVGGTVVRPRPVAPIPYVPRYYAPAPPIFIGFNFVIPIQPMVYRSETPESEDDLPFPPDAPAPMVTAPAPPPEAPGSSGLPHPPEAYASNGPPAPPDAGPPIELPPLSPPADFVVEDRGFFAGPHVALQVDLVDRATGEVLWSRPVASDGNPLDVNDVRQLLHAALVNESWATGPAFSRR
jgi:hypothetical protein